MKVIKDFYVIVDCDLAAEANQNSAQWLGQNICYIEIVKMYEVIKIMIALFVT